MMLDELETVEDGSHAAHNGKHEYIHAPGFLNNHPILPRSQKSVKTLRFVSEHGRIQLS